MTALRFGPARVGVGTIGTIMAVLVGAYAGLRAFKTPAKKTLAESRRSSPRLKKRNPDELDKMLDTAVADSMAASDPPTISRLEVRSAK